MGYESCEKQKEKKKKESRDWENVGKIDLTRLILVFEEEEIKKLWFKKFVLICDIYKT